MGSRVWKLVPLRIAVGAVKVTEKALDPQGMSGGDGLGVLEKKIAFDGWRDAVWDFPKGVVVL